MRNASEASLDTEYLGRPRGGQRTAKPRYPIGCSAGLKAPGEASSSDNAIYVNFNNGNVNWNNRNNKGFARFVRRVPASECQDAVTLQDLIVAERSARRRKKPSRNMLSFQMDWVDGLFDLREEINSGTWSPRATRCFIAEAPKAREIHAPDYRDRVLHHWLVPKLEPLFPFIADSYSNQKGKGTLAAVKRLHQFFRQVESGQGGGYFLQLDVKNFFNSIYRPTLWTMLKRAMERAGTPMYVQRATHALLRHSPATHGVIHRSTSAQRALVPAHKRLESAAPGCGLPIGNLSSQFFANVYLSPLDYFVKHVLKAQRYDRYVDDFVLVHRSRDQLLEWKAQIEAFLRRELRLELKAEWKLQPLTEGCDFLGYVVRPSHLRVRRRVISHARQKLAEWEAKHFDRATLTVKATPEQCREIQSVWASYVGHFAHARSFRLQQGFYKRFVWLAPIVRAKRRFDPRLEGRSINLRIHGA